MIRRDLWEIIGRLEEEVKGEGGGGEDVNSELLECLLRISPSGRNPCGDNYRAETGSAAPHGETIC